MIVELAAKVLQYLWPAVTTLFLAAILTLPLAAFQRTRRYVMYVLWLFKGTLSITLWVWSSIVALVLWGWTAAIIGLFIEGIGFIERKLAQDPRGPGIFIAGGKLIPGAGVIPVAFLAAAFEGQWDVFIQMLVTLIVVIVNNWVIFLATALPLHRRSIG